MGMMPNVRAKRRACRSVRIIAPISQRARLSAGLGWHAMLFAESPRVIRSGCGDKRGKAKLNAEFSGSS